MTEGTKAPYGSDEYYAGNTDNVFADLFGSRRAKRRKKSKKTRRTTRNKYRKRKSTRRVYKRRNKRKTNNFKGGVRYTKNGQPYRIMSNGRARFIKR